VRPNQLRCAVGPWRTSLGASPDYETMRPVRTDAVRRWAVDLFDLLVATLARLEREGAGAGIEANTIREVVCRITGITKAEAVAAFIRINKG
jgi:hypothetical protein